MSLEQFNQHQQDVLSRTNSLARAVLILAGGALSISIGLFLNGVDILSCAKPILEVSWWSLTITILSLILMLFVTLSRDYFFGERWRKQLDGKIDNANENQPVIDIIIWVFAITALLSFFIGFISLTYVATNSIS